MGMEMWLKVGLLYIFSLLYLTLNAVVSSSLTSLLSLLGLPDFAFCISSTQCFFLIFFLQWIQDSRCQKTYSKRFQFYIASSELSAISLSLYIFCSSFLLSLIMLRFCKDQKSSPYHAWIILPNGWIQNVCLHDFFYPGKGAGVDRVYFSTADQFKRWIFWWLVQFGPAITVSKLQSFA